jgi:PAS domain S-box-containing protein
LGRSGNPTDTPAPATTFLNSLVDRLSSIGQAVLAFGQADERFQQVIKWLPAAIYTTDAAGRITFYNDAAVAMWGRQPTLGDDLWCGSWKLYWPDGMPLPHDECPMAIALKTRRAVRGVEAVAERPDGTRIPFAAYPTPIFDAGELVGAVNMLVDLTDRKRFDEYRQRLASVVHSSDDAIISKDLNGIITSWNSGAERLFGYSADEVVRRSVTILIPPDRANEEPSILERLRRGERIDHYETVRRRKDGSLVDISLTVSPIHGADGRIIGASKIARDITERKRAQEEQKLLLAEIMHRVKNTLATVQAIATQTLRRAPTDEREAFRARLHALSSAHDLLTTERWDRAALRDVVTAALAPFDRQRLSLDGPDTWVNARQALQVTLALHELATNASKYGALSTTVGRIQVAWKLKQSGIAKLYWQERGGPPARLPEHKGFGSTLIEQTFDNARFRFGEKGLACSFEIPS